MENQIVKFKSDTGQEVTITPQDIKNVICPGATDKEITMFLELCKAQRLNPFIKDAYLVKYGNSPASMITGKEVFTKRANANKDFDGMEHGVVYMDKNGNVNKRPGAAIYKMAGEILLGGWAAVYLKSKSRPVYAELSLEEYSTGKSNWAKMPGVMINKCAQVAALRLAFPSDFQGLYAAEEMGAPGEVVQQQQNAPQTAPQIMQQPQEAVEVEEMAVPEQLDMINELATRFAKLRGKTAAEAIEALETAQGVAVQDMTQSQAYQAIVKLDNWNKKAAEKALQAEREAALEAEADAYIIEPDTTPCSIYDDAEYLEQEGLQ